MTSSAVLFTSTNNSRMASNAVMIQYKYRDINLAILLNTEHGLVNDNTGWWMSFVQFPLLKQPQASKWNDAHSPSAYEVVTILLLRP